MQLAPAGNSVQINFSCQICIYATTSISPTNALHKIAKCIECSPDIFKICILLSVNTYILQNSMKLCTLKGLSNR